MQDEEHAFDALESTYALDIELTEYATLMDQTMAFNSPRFTANAERDNEAFESERFSVLEMLGEGAMGQVYLAQDKMLSRKLAYKMLRPEWQGQVNLLDQFYREAQITAQLEHPGMIPVYAMEQPDGHTLAYAMKQVKGRTLKDKLDEFKVQVNQEPKSWWEGYRQLLQKFLVVCDTLDFAHQKGIIHRDLKPANIMIGAYSEVYLMDWGIAAPVGQPQIHADLEPVEIESWDDADNDTRTQMGRIVGTPRYMSPEQAAGLSTALKPSSDIYSLGLILFEISYLKPAFKAQGLKALMERVKANQLDLFDSPFKAVHIPTEMQRIITRATQKEPSERYTSAAQMGADIRAFLNDLETRVYPDNLPRRMMRWIRHHPQQSLLAVMMLILVSGLLVLSSLYLNQRTIQNNRLRRVSIQTLLTQTTFLTQDIDAWFNHYENLLEQLSARSREAQSRGQAPAPSPVLPNHVSLWPQPAQFPPALQVIAASFVQIQSQAHDPRAQMYSLQRHQSPLLAASVKFKTQHQLMFTPKSSPEELRKTFVEISPDSLYLPLWQKANAKGLSVMQGLYSESNQYLGWAGLMIDIQDLQQILKKFEISGLQSLHIFDTEFQPILTQGDSARLPEKAFTEANSGYFESEGHIHRYQKLGSVPWYVLVSVNKSELFEAHEHVLE